MYENFPAELKALPQWVCRRGKMPINPRTGYGAKAGQPDTWADFKTAMQASINYDGIGFEFHNNGIVGVDLDHVIEPATGEIDPTALETVKRLNSYTEYSPSGTGLHIYVRGRIPEKGRKDDKKGREMYQAARYFTVTGKPFGAPLPLAARSKEIAALFAEWFPTPSIDKPKQPAPQSIPPGQKNYLAMGLEKDSVFLGLWEGNRPNGNESADDQALMNKLAYWCNCNLDLMKTAFLESPHFQQKDERHKKKAARRADYLDRTARKAIAGCERTAEADDARWQEQRRQSHNRKGVTIGKPPAPEPDGTIPPPPTEGAYINIEIVDSVLKRKGISVRYNELLKITEIKGLPKAYSSGNAQNTLPTLLVDYLKACGVKGVNDTRVENCLNCIADRNRFNPIHAYLNAGKWDGVDRFAEIYRILGVSEPKYRVYIRKWFHQGVALGLNAESTPTGGEGILTLCGGQGCGKTSFFRIITPDRRWFVEGVVIDMTNKDSIITALSGWICELGELDSTLKREQSSLKAFITKPEDRIRIPYGRSDTISPRRTSFCGTVNNENFLKDETGSRRFWIVPVTTIDKDALFNLDRDFVHQLWLQSYEDYKKNPQGFRLTDAEMARLQEDNKAFDAPIQYEVEIREMLDWDLPVEQWEWWKSGDIARKIPGNADAGRVGRALRKIVSSGEVESFWGGVGGVKNPRLLHGNTEYLLPLRHPAPSWVR